MAAFDEPLHAAGKHQSQSERRRGIANQPSELVPDHSSLGRKFLHADVHDAYLARYDVRGAAK